MFHRGILKGYSGSIGREPGGIQWFNTGDKYGTS